MRCGGCVMLQGNTIVLRALTEDNHQDVNGDAYDDEKRYEKAI